MGTFLDSFLPNIAQSAAQAPIGMMEGRVQGQQMAGQLAHQEAMTNLVNHQAAAMGQPNAKLQALKMVQDGIAKDPNFLNTPLGQFYGGMAAGHQMGQQHPIVAAPGSQVFMPGVNEPRQVPSEAKGFAPGSLALIPDGQGGMKQVEVPFGPKTVAPGAQLINPNEINPDTGQARVLAAPTQMGKGGAGGGQEAILSPKSLDFMAAQYLSGDKSVLQNLGRGMQGAANIVKLREKIVEQAAKAGMSPQQVALAMAEFVGENAAQRNLGNRSVTFGVAQAEALKMADLVTQTSSLFERSNFPLANKAIQAFETGTGDVNTMRYGAALNSFVNAYTRAISPTGQPTVHDKEHAREMLARPATHEQVVGVIDLMKAEMEAAGQAPRMIKQERRDQFGKAGLPESPMLKQSPLAQQQKAGPSAITPGAIPRITNDAQYNALAKGTIFEGPDGKRRRKP